jgi:CheY-like chemotaxis protein
VLVIDDNKTIRETLEEALDESGYQVVTAGNGKEGLSRLRGLPRPCVVIIDLMMPVMNGWEFLRQARQEGALAGAKVIITSASDLKELPVGAAGWLRKPMDLDDLLNIVEKYSG